MNEWWRALIVAGAGSVFVVVTVLPSALMVIGSLLSPTGRWTLDAYRGVLTDVRQWQLLTTSLSVAGGASAVAAALGLPLGVAISRGGFEKSAWWRLLLIAPLFVPPYVMAVAWALALGPTGPIAAVVSPEHLTQWIYSASGAAVVLGSSLSPLVAFSVDAALTRVNARAEEAGQLVASPWRVFRRITLPLIAPVIGAALLLVFVLAITDFGVPALLRVRVYTTEVFTAFSAFYDSARATALAAPLLVLVFIVTAVATWMAEPASLHTRRLVVARGSPARRVHQAALVALVVGAVVTLILPMAALSYDAWSGRGTAFQVETWSAVGTSLIVAGLTATVVIGVSAVLAYVRTHIHRQGWLFDLVCVWLFAVPSTIVGIGLVRTWNRPVMEALYGTWGMLVIASTARFLPLGVLLVAVAARQVSTSLEEAATLAGASWIRMWRRVWLPQLRGILVAVWSITFVLAFGELGASVVVTPAGTMTLPVHVYTLVANAPPGQLARLTLVQALIGLASVLIIDLARSARAEW